MAASPRWKVYTYDDRYIASTVDPLYAAMIVAGVGHAGTTIRDGHSKRSTVYTEGGVLADGSVASASESYDAVAEACHNTAAFLKEGFRGRP
jgi:hypothetical protein